MKPVFRFVIIIVVSIFSTSLYGQQRSIDLSRKINLPATELSVDSLLPQLSRQSGVQFSFNSRRISPSRKLRFSSRTQTVRQVLQQLDHVLSIRYKLVGNHVILVDKPKKELPPKKVISQKDTAKQTLQATVQDRAVDLTIEAPPATRLSSTSDTTQRTEAAIDSVRVKHDTLSRQPVTIVPEKTTDTVTIAMVRHTSDSIVEASRPLTKPMVPGNKKFSSGGTGTFLRNMRLELGLRGVGLNYEVALGPKSSIEVAAGLGAGYLVTGKNFYYSMQVQDPALYISIRPKFFFKSRSEASNYFIGGQLKYHSAQLFSNPGTIDESAKWISAKGYTNSALFLDVHAGYQRRLGERWTFTGHAGIGYAVSSNSTGYNHWYPAVGLQLTYRLKR